MLLNLFKRFNANPVYNFIIGILFFSLFFLNSRLISFLYSQLGKQCICTHKMHFSSSKRLCCWAGLTPGSNESAGKKKSVRITRAGVYLKPALVQCAHAAVKSDKTPYYKKKYESLVKRRGKKRAIIAIARMILTAIYQMLSTGEQWNPSDLYKIDMPVALVEKQKAKAIKQAKKLLQREGLLPPDEPLAS